MEKHAAYRLYTCSFCSLDIVHYQGLLTHMRNQHSSLYKDSAKLFQRLPESDFFHFCNLCNAGFPNFETMNRHLISVHKDIFDITDKQNLAKSKSQTGTEMFSHKKASCPSCNISFENQLALSWHMFMMHMSSACKSQSIDQNNRNKSLLRLRTKTSDKSQKQKEKKNATRSRGKTSDKSQKQREKKNAIRRESFASGNESRQSVYNAKKSVGNSKAEHVNEMSGQTFIRVDSFKRHRTRVVSGQYDCICELCGKWYSRMDKLKDHIRTKHLNIRYRCDFCNVTLKARTGTMKNHMENHFGLVVKDKYPCLTCGKMLSSFDSLKSID